MITTGDNRDAYNYEGEEDKQFFEYNTEQQASIIGGWAGGGFSQSDWRFRYVRDNIRPGLPNAISTPIRQLTESEQAFRDKYLNAPMQIRRTFSR